MTIKPLTYLILANTVDLFLREAFLLTGEARNKWLNEDNYAANRALFYEGDNKIVLSPLPMERILVETCKQQLGYQNLTCWYPNRYIEHSLCKSVLNDSMLFPKVVEAIVQNPNIIITSYSYSPDFEDFINHLKSLGLKFQLDNAPTHVSIVRKLNAKANFRRVAEAIEHEFGIQLIPKGKILANLEGALREIRAFVLAKTGFVVKANYGVAGIGLFISPTVPTEHTITSFLECVEKNRLWADSELIVESKITAKSVHSPSIELKISANNIAITYLCNQILNENGAFLGIALGKNVVSPMIENQMRRTALLIATDYQSMGYRGFFDIDFVIDDAQKAFAVETNARRTGGTHVYDILRFRYGADWQEKVCVASNDSWHMNQQFKKSDNVLERFKKILYDGEEGLIITNFCTVLDVFGFVLIAKTPERLQILFNQMKSSDTNFTDFLN